MQLGLMELTELEQYATDGAGAGAGAVLTLNLRKYLI
jgi:hypothetical protein